MNKAQMKRRGFAYCLTCFKCDVDIPVTTEAAKDPCPGGTDIYECECGTKLLIRVNENGVIEIAGNARDIFPGKRKKKEQDVEVQIDPEDDDLTN